MPSRAELVTDDLDEALAALRAGGLVAIPTETVYGLAADAERREAVARIYAVKGRPTDHPLIVHLSLGDPTAPDWLDGWVADVPDDARILAGACWPGPLTLLLPRGPRVGDWVTGGRETVGIRVPAHPVTAELLERFGGGVAAPSANRFGKVSPTTADHVLHDLGPVLDPARDRILDGGASLVGVESTIVDLTVDPPQILRTGAIDAETVARILERPVTGASGPSRAAGMLASHYAPDCPVVLAESRADAERLADERRAAGERVRVLDRTDDLVVAARRLYDDLRAADHDGIDVLVAVMPEAAGLGHAIRDRLAKAAATGP